MITEMSKDQVAEIGSRNRAGYLLEQSGLTLGLAKMDGNALAELLPPKYEDEVIAAEESVRYALKDRTLASEESKSSTQQVNELVRETKVWRRAVAARAKRAVKMGKKIPNILLVSEGMKGIPGISTQMDKMIQLLEANSENLPGENNIYREGIYIKSGCCIELKHCLYPGCLEGLIVLMPANGFISNSRSEGERKCKAW